MNVREGRLFRIGIGTALLFGSCLVAWYLPAPQQCVSIDCGRNFNPDQVTWHPVSFWNWSQLVAVGFGLVAFVTMILIAVLFTLRRR